MGEYSVKETGGSVKPMSFDSSGFDTLISHHYREVTQWFGANSLRGSIYRGQAKVAGESPKLLIHDTVRFCSPLPLVKEKLLINMFGDGKNDFPAK